jgi:hemerythrin-like metal-binding protein
MPEFTWEERFSLSVPEVDAQHKYWFALTDAYWEKFQAKRVNSALVQQALAATIAYARKHFKAEEALMRRIRFPQNEYRLHCSMHNAFVERVNALAKRCRAGHPNAAEELVEFLVGWLVRHIIQVDVKYVGYYKCGEGSDKKISVRSEAKRKSSEKAKVLADVRGD